MEESSKKSHHEPWNKGKLVGQKAPFKLKEIWATRVRLQVEHRVRELAMFDLGLDSKLRACDLVKLKVRDICNGDRVAARAIIMQQRTAGSVQFEITESTQHALSAWIKDAKLRSEDFLFPSRIHNSPHLGTRQYARIVDNCAADWTGPLRIRNPFHEAHQGIAHLPSHQKPTRRAIFTWPRQGREHCPLSGHRGG